MIESELNVNEGMIELDYVGQTLHFEFNNDNNLLALLCNNEGEFVIKQENMQKELKSIKDIDVLKAYLSNAFYKITKLDDGDYKLQINQKGLGGMPTKNSDNGNKDKDKGGNKTKEKCVSVSGCSGPKGREKCIEVKICNSTSTKKK